MIENPLRARRRPGVPGLPAAVHRRSLSMSHPLHVLAAVAAAPLLGLSMHAMATHVAAGPAVHAAAVLPNNLCSSCHGGGRVVSLDAAALDARDLVAARTYLQAMPHG
jgi:hypothetical protein